MSADHTDHEGDNGDEESGADEYEKFQRLDRAEYDRVNDFLDGRVRFTAREWAIARLCADFRTPTGVPMTMLGENLPELVPYMDEPYSAQAVNQAKTRFDDKVQIAASTFLYGALSGFYTPDELEKIMYEATETAKFLLETEGTQIELQHEQDVEDRIAEAMSEVRQASDRLKEDLETDDE